jgi:putative nucleotidyltransferase with HDIG domain
MQRITLDSIKPGMALASDILVSDGRFVFSKGAILSPADVRILKIWGVHSVEVECPSAETKPLTEETVDPVTRGRAEEFTRSRFSLTDMDHPFIQELFHICVVRNARRMMQTSEPADVCFQGESVLNLSAREHNGCPAPEVDLNALVDEATDLASLPTIFMEISEVISDPRSSAVHVANVISKDVNLSAKLLRLVNSAYYSFPYKIDTISRAVTIIGSRQLSTLALGASVLKAFRGIPEDLVDMESFWKHSITCGITARMIASHKKILNTERLFVAGLLHDIGKIILYQRVPDLAFEMFLRARQIPRLFRSVEREDLGYDHADLGGAVLEKWNLPQLLTQTVSYHHTPLSSPHPTEASIINLSDILTNALELGNSGECLVPPLIPGLWDSLGLEKEILSRIIPLVERQVEETIKLFFDHG